MGMDLMYSAGDRRHVIKFTMADFDALAEINNHLPDAVGLMLDTPGFGVSEIVPRESLSDAAHSVLVFLTDHAEVLPFTYQFKTESYKLTGCRDGTEEFGTGGLGGIRLVDDDTFVYGLDARLNVLELTKYAVNNDGSGSVVEKKDLRGEKQLVTKNRGLIKFRKRKSRTRLCEELDGIVKFLNSLQANEVEKLVG